MIKNSMDQYIREIHLLRDTVYSWDAYPFSLAAVKALTQLKLHPNVTFLVGENGSGKSTLLEAIATAYGFNPEGGTKNFNFATEETHSDLHKAIRLVKGVRKPMDGFFLRAESFYNVASQIDKLDREGIGNRIIDSYGGVSLHRQSHGESFMSLFLHRLGGCGLYLFDEPEAALSPMRQMAMIARLHDLVKENSQFVIATHSPLLLAYPNAKIFLVDEGYREVCYEETEHYQVTRRFLNDPASMLEILMD